MSLSRQMIIFIAVMVLALLLVTFALNLNHTKNFLQEQLKSHSQDTATSLGLSLSTIPDPEDISSMETMINAVFDRGYYAHINLSDMDGKTIYHRQNATTMEDVPTWFINLIHLETPSAESMIQAGWFPIGSLTVSSHAGYAYIQLWDTTKDLLIGFIIAAIIAILIAIYTIRIMLKPLSKMQIQAKAIVKKQYIIQEDLPRTIEFKQVVVATNAMVNKLRAVFERDANAAEKLQKLAYQDSVTGLSNRRHFEMIIDSILDPQQDVPEGSICLLRINHLKELNDQMGYLVGDQLVKTLADQLKSKLTHEESVFARLNGTELVALLPRVKAKKLAEATQKITGTVDDILQDFQADQTGISISIGYTDYKPGQSRGPLLGQLDFAIQQAEEKGKNCSFYFNTNQESDNHESWEQTINQAIEEKRFMLYQQSAYNNDHEVHDQELFIRLKDTDGVVRSAGYFMPAVEKLNKIAQIDELVINLITQYLKTHNDTPILAINLSKAIVDNEVLQNKLITTLKDNPTIAQRIAVEMPERLVIEQKGLTWPLLQQLKSFGVHIGIDHFGSRLGNMLYLQELNPDYVKLDASFSKAIDSDEQTVNYVSSLCELTDSLDIDVVAMAVENEEQVKAMSELGVKYYQGYLFGAPVALNE